jgi:hypothetical protein
MDTLVSTNDDVGYNVTIINGNYCIYDKYDAPGIKA